MSWIAYDIMIASLFWRCHIMPCSSISRPCHVSFQFTHVMYTPWLAQSHGITKALSPGSVSFNASISAMSSLPTENRFAKTIGFVLGIMDWQEALGSPWGWTFDVMMVAVHVWRQFLQFQMEFLSRGRLQNIHTKYIHSWSNRAFFSWGLRCASLVGPEVLICSKDCATSHTAYITDNLWVWLLENLSIETPLTWMFLGFFGSLVLQVLSLLGLQQLRFSMPCEDFRYSRTMWAPWSCWPWIHPSSSFMATHGKWGLNEGMRFL